MPRGRNVVAFPVPSQGLITNLPLHRIPQDAASSQSYNMFVDVDGLLKARPGYTQAGTNAPGGRLIGGIGFIAENAANVVGLVSNLTQWWALDTGVTWRNVTDGSNPQTGTADILARFVSFFEGAENKIYAYGVNGVNPMRRFHPLDANYQTVAAAPIARDICAVGSRLMTIYTTEGGLNYPYRVRWSSVDDGTTWPALAVNNLVDADGPLVACRTFGRLTAAIYATNSIFLAVGQSGDDATAFGFQQIPGAIVGPMSNSSVVVVDNIHYYLGRDARVWRFDGVHCDPISANIDIELRNQIGLQQKDFFPRMHGMFSPLTRQIIFWFPTVGAQDPSRAIAYNLDYQRFDPFWNFPDAITFSESNGSLAAFPSAGFPQPHCYVGTASNGAVNQFGQEVATSDGGAAIAYGFHSFLYRSDPTQTSLPESLELLLVPATVSDNVTFYVMAFQTPGINQVTLFQKIVDVSDPTMFSIRIQPQPNQALVKGYPFLQFRLMGSTMTQGLRFGGAELWTHPEQRPIVGAV